MPIYRQIQPLENPFLEKQILSQDKKEGRLTFVCKTAENVKEAKELIESGYQYVCDMDNLKLFKKRK